MAVDADETGVLDQHFKASDSSSMNPNDRSWCDGPHRAADGRRQINAAMKRAGQRSAQHDARPKW
jgi:hypothetical protein